MSLNYSAVQWNRQKRIYDGVLAGGVALYLGVFAGLTRLLYPAITDEILILRAFGSAAFILLHGILCIGPLCRLDQRFLPLLYNRRHAGVTCFLLAAVHAALVLLTYHAGGDLNPFLSLFVSTPVRLAPAAMPFQAFGFVGLFILFLMAATSHDFWLANLTAPVWKALHMSVYVAYALLVLHVTFGVLQAETSPLLVVATAVGMVAVLGLHLASAARERRTDAGSRRQVGVGDRSSGCDVEPSCGPVADSFLFACSVGEIPEKRARTVCLGGERVAIFKYDGCISAVSSVCQHQNGPLGEGKIVDGCITCPWHGYQYQPEDGASPAPFVEKVPTFRVQIRSGRVYVDPRPYPAGTRVEPARLDDGWPAGEVAVAGSTRDLALPVDAAGSTNRMAATP